jgi:hypothetical protein
MFRKSGRKQTIPPFSAENPGQAASIVLEFSDDERTWQEEVDATRILAEVLKAGGVKARAGEERVELEHELILRPQIVELQPRDDGSVRTATTIEINHPDLCPDGLFEYQHAIGGTFGESLQRGFENWLQLDLPVFIEPFRSKKKQLSSLVLEYPAKQSGTAVKRQVILGPVSHRASREVQDADEEHSFCPCCLFTNCMNAFQEQLETDRFYGIRLYAFRNSEGAAEADCRINGVDWQAGTQALLKYVESWPDRGMEIRKQFVAIRTVS